MIGQTIAAIKEDCIAHQEHARKLKEELTSNLEAFLTSFDKMSLEAFPSGLSSNIDKLIDSAKTQYRNRYPLIAIESQYENIIFPALDSELGTKIISNASLDYYQTQAKKYITTRTEKLELKSFNLTEAVARKTQQMECIQQSIFKSGHKLNVALYQKEILILEKELITRKISHNLSTLTQLRLALEKLEPKRLSEMNQEGSDVLDADFDFGVESDEEGLKLTSCNAQAYDDSDPFDGFSSDDSDSTNDPFDDGGQLLSSRRVDLSVSTTFTPGFSGAQNSMAVQQTSVSSFTSCDKPKYN
tara:strand:- start:3336 stop:4238 length:903 start_codon:yes stop_codon:yes gene_type:complete